MRYVTHMNELCHTYERVTLDAGAWMKMATVLTTTSAGSMSTIVAVTGTRCFLLSQTLTVTVTHYGLASLSSIDEIIGLFRKRAL